MKLFITDYDGTLLIDTIKIEKNIKKLQKLQEHGFKIIISTGRSYPSIKNQVDIYKIPYDYLSCADGSIVFNKDGNILKMFTIDKKIIMPLQVFYQKINYEEIQFSYPTGYSNILKEDDNLLGINICISTFNCDKKTVNSFLELKKNYPNYNYLHYSHPNFSYLCVKPKGIDKSKIIAFLKRKHQIKKKDIYVIGDSDNDYEMIKKYHGSCMENSCSKILKIAKNKYQSVSLYIDDILKEDYSEVNP